MPFVLRPAVPPGPGVVIFTHKERTFFDDPIPLVAELLRKVKTRYIVGVHWGHYHNDVGPMPWADFHLAGAGTLEFAPGVDALHIPLGSRNFTPACFHDRGLERQWDLLAVARPLKLKNLDQLLAAVRLLYDRGNRLRVLLVAPAPMEMRGAEWYASIYDDYLRLFDEEERDHFTLMILRDGNPFPLGRDAMAWLYASSKVFILLSEQEGESRVVAEALLSGCLVAARAGIRGGADDYLDAENSGRFDDVESAAAVVEQLASEWGVRRVDLARLRRELTAEYSIPRLQEELREHFAERGLVIDDQWRLDDLDRQLPSHVLTLPADLRLAGTNDLRSPRAAFRFLESLVEDQSPSAGRLTRLRLESARQAAGTRLRLWIGRTRFRLGAVAMRLLPTRLAQRIGGRRTPR